MFLWIVESLTNLYFGTKALYFLQVAEDRWLCIVKGNKQPWSTVWDRQEMQMVSTETFF